MTALTLEDQEDNVLRLVALEAEGKAVLLSGMRRTAKDLLEIFSQINAANIYDFNIVEQLFNGKTSVEGLSDDQQKLLKNIIKEEHSAGKSKEVKETESKPYERPAAAEAASRRGRLGIRATVLVRATGAAVCGGSIPGHGNAGLAADAGSRRAGLLEIP